ncbi:MAG TPA: GWxTD domain-containing protein [Pyrinomonadaceae bacterium]|jgi:GWxTD domain-containing protein|nr:GWxTD domain-containing protein [Pyrinomonadaceae bacterium]
MSYQNPSLRLAVFALLLFGTGLLGFAQDRAKSQDPMDKARNVKPELKKAYKDWLEKDVTYVITDEERKAFKKLATDDERERFIEEFWRRRDPDPDTDENEFKEEYYERIAYANEHFASGIPGWKSDRGRIWIMYGKPDELETHPSGGSYDRPSYEGGGNTTTYPFEIWFYRYLAGVGSGIEIEFVDPTGSGEYRIARSPDEKDAMLNIPGAGLTLSEQLGLSDKADRIGGVGGVGNTQYTREQDSPFARLQLLADLARPPQVKFNDLASAVNTGVIEENPLNFDVRVDFFRQSDERVITAITIQVENKDLVFQDSGGLLQSRINIFGKITAVSGRRAGVFEDPVITTATAQELSDAKERKSAYQKAVALAPGTYKVDVIVRDVASGATGVRHIALPVPKYDPQKLSTSTLVLAARLESLVDQPAVGQFVIGQTKVIPNVSGVYHRGQPVGVYMQVYNAGIDQTTLRPSVDVEYALMKDGKEVGKQTEDWRGLSDSGQRLTLARLIDTRQLAAGDYELTIRIRDRVSGQALSPAAKFTVLAQ